MSADFDLNNAAAEKLVFLPVKSDVQDVKQALTACVYTILFSHVLLYHRHV